MRRTRDEWTVIVERYQDSGMTVRRFCQEEGIIEPSLRNWITRIRSESESVHGFVEVQAATTIDRHGSAEAPILDPPANRHGLTIRFQDGTAIDIHPDTDRNILEWVLTLMAKRK